MGTRVTAIYEHDVRELRKECPDVSLITCHDETLCVTWFTGMDGALIGFAGCVPELITGAWEVFSHSENTLSRKLRNGLIASTRFPKLSMAAASLPVKLMPV